MSAGLRNGTATREDMEGALNRLLSCDINRETLINAVHVPPEAGLYAAALEQILRRIPDGGPLDQPRRGLVPDRGRLRCAARRD